MKHYLLVTSLALFLFSAISTLPNRAEAAGRCTDIFELSTPESMAVRLTEIQNVEAQIFALQDQIATPPVGWLGKLLSETNLKSREASLQKLNAEYKELVLRLAKFATYPININWVNAHLNYRLYFSAGARQAFVWMMERRTEATTPEQHEFLNSLLLYMTYSKKFNPPDSYTSVAATDWKTEDFPLWVSAVYTAYKDQPQIIAQYARELKISVMMYNYEGLSSGQFNEKSRDQVNWQRNSQSGYYDIGGRMPRLENANLADFTPLQFTGYIRDAINAAGYYYYPETDLFYIESPYGVITWRSAHTRDDLHFRPFWLTYYR